MDDLKSRLKYVRSLLTAMSNLNGEEVVARGQMRQIVPAQYIPLEKSTKKGGRVAALAVLFVTVMLFVMLMSAWRIWGEAKDAYRKPITFGEACIRALPTALADGVVLTVIVGAVVFAMQRSRNETIDRENARREEEYRKALRWNEQAAIINQKIEEQAKEIQGRRQRISHEYITNICPWFPQEYCYFEAVDFFLHELETGIAETFRDAVNDYRENLRHRALMEQLDGLGRRMEVIIGNQRVMIDRQEEMIRQQMLGNVIATANLIQTMNIANNTRNIANNTGQIARNTGKINAGIRGK